MGTESTFNTESIIAAANTLDAEGSPAVSTATDVSTNILLKQGPEKWGTEAGPSEFSSKYSLYLSNLEREMAIMRDQLDSFIASVRASAVAVENNESSVAEAVEHLARRSSPMNRRGPMVIVWVLRALPLKRQTQFHPSPHQRRLLPHHVLPITRAQECTIPSGNSPGFSFLPLQHGG